MRLTQMQFKEILSNMMTEANGVTRLMELIIEIAMEGERELYKKDIGDVSNGYRPRRMGRGIVRARSIVCPSLLKKQ